MLIYSEDMNSGKMIFILESEEGIAGIFYIYNDMIVPDYSTESLLSVSKLRNDRRMYHTDFFEDYMRNKYHELRYENDDSIPRGRVSETIKVSVMIT